uniref:Histone acetyltransferase n=1 Tax=Panagrolaimus sp. JU765 TaxID=591449 RepID=A0AC34RJW4_9BILA
MEDHPHKKKIPSRSYDDEELDGFNELDAIESGPAENQMHNGSVDSQIYASTSMQQPSSSQSQMTHGMHNYQTTNSSSQSGSVLQDLLLSGNNTMTSPRNQQFNNSYRPMGRSPITGATAGSTTMVSPPAAQPRPPMNVQQIRQQAPNAQQIQQQQQQGGQGYENYQMQANNQHQNFAYQGNPQMVRNAMRPTTNQGQAGMIRVMNGNPPRKEYMRAVQMTPNGPVMRVNVSQTPNPQFDQNYPVNGTQNGGPTTSRPQSTNVEQQSAQFQVMAQNYVVQGVVNQQRPSTFHSGPIQNGQVYFVRADQIQGGPQGSQVVQSATMNGPTSMNGNIRPQINHVQQQPLSNNVQAPQSQRLPQPQQSQTNIIPNQPLPLQDPQSQGPQSIQSVSMPQQAGTPNYATQDPEKRRLIQQQLVLLLHAHKCQQREKGDGPGRNNCNLPHCQTMKSVLEHMTSCQSGRSCNFPHCASSRQIIAHWKNCVKDDCPVCKPLKCFNRNTAPGGSGSFGSPQPPNSGSILSDADNSFDPFRSPNPPNRAASGSGINGQHRTPSQSALASFGSMSNESIASLPPPDPPSQQKEWHVSIGKDLRNHLVGKLVKAIFPSPDPAAMQDQRIKDLISYARKVEKDMFEIAQDREEYYHLLAEKIYKIQKELQEKKNRRLEQSHQRSDSMSNLPSQASIKADIQQDASRTAPGSEKPIEQELDIKPDIKPKIEPLDEKDEIKLPAAPAPTEDIKVPKKEIVEEIPKEPVQFDPDELRKLLLSVWKTVDSIEEAFPFRVPVNPEALGIPEYSEIIKNPMDLLTIRSKLDSFAYSNPREFCADVWLMFDNAWLFNKKSSKVYKFCTRLCEVFVETMNPVMEKLGYCCSNRYNFTPLALFCYGQSMCIIQRDQPYYLYESSSSKYNVVVSERVIYCQKCFEQLPDVGYNLNENPNEAPNYATKDKFTLMRNDQIEAEPFETCKVCDRPWHRICANFCKKVYPDGFICDNCRKAKSIPKPDNKFTAKKLPHCKLSQHIENRVNNFIKKRCKDSKDKHEVVIRVLCSSDKEVEVKPMMKKKYAPQGFPEKFPYRTKALFAFEVVDGVEICFFGLHVQEYGSECAKPNQRRVYIAYLDSVHFFQPRELRTDVYHEILLAYLDYVRKLGYTMAHIWACPPSEGDDYIFHCHPPEQKIPKPKRLQDWYKKMLDKGISDGVVCEYKDIYKQAKDDKLESPMGLPYFEGDYWPNVIEDCIRDVEKEEADRKLQDDLYDDEDDIYTLDDAKARKSITNSAPSNKKAKSLKKSGSSKKKKGSGSGNEVTEKLLSCLEKQKEVFFTIRLISYQSELTVIQTPIEDPDPLVSSDLMDGRDNFLTKAREEHWEFSSLRRAKYSTLCLCHALHTQENKDMNYTCNNCQRSACWHCNVCDDFDLCNACYQNNSHEHKLEKIQTLIEADKNTESSNSRNESIQRCIQSLVHACQCRDANCRKVTCHKMKKVVQHTKLCKKRQHTSCPVCKQLIALCCYHAKHCNQKQCAVPFCSNIRQKLQEQKRLQTRRADMLMRRRMDLLQAGQAGGNSSQQVSQQQPAPLPPQPVQNNSMSKPPSSATSSKGQYMGKMPNTQSYHMNNAQTSNAYPQNAQMNQNQYQQQQAQMRMGQQNPQMLQQRQMNQNSQQQTQQMYAQPQNPQYARQNQQNYMVQNANQGVQQQQQQYVRMQQQGNVPSRPVMVVQGMQQNQNMMRPQGQQDTGSLETLLGNQTVQTNIANNHHPGKAFNDPQIQTIVERLKCAKSEVERSNIFRELKKTPHLCAVFLKFNNSQYKHEP